MRLQNGEKIVAVIMSEKKATQLDEKLKNLFPDKNGNCYTGKSCNKEDFKRVEEVWIELDWVIITMVATIGVDFDKEHFDTLFVYACLGSAIVRDLCQAMMRVRKISNNLLYYVIKPGFRQCSYGYTMKSIKWHMNQRNKKLIDIKNTINNKLQQALITTDGRPAWLKQLEEHYIYEQNSTNINFRGYFNAYLKIMNYKRVSENLEVEEEKTSQKIVELPKYDDIPAITYNEKMKLEKDKRSGILTPNDAYKLDKYLFKTYINLEAKEVETEELWKSWIGDKKTAFRSKIYTIYRLNRIMHTRTESSPLTFPEDVVNNLFEETPYFTLIGANILKTNWASEILSKIIHGYSLLDKTTVTVERFNDLQLYIEKNEKEIRKDFTIRNTRAQSKEQLIRSINVILSSILGMKIYAKYKNKNKVRYLDHYVVEKTCGWTYVN